MLDSLFIDTNVILYATLLPQNEKEAINKQIDRDLLNKADNSIVISTQVVAEFANVLIKKSSYTKDEIVVLINNLISNMQVISVNTEILLSCIEIWHRYRFSFYDSLIVASALSANCSYLITEDLQDQQVINYQNHQIQVVNPFQRNAL